MMAVHSLIQHTLPVFMTSSTPTVSTTDIQGIMSAVTDQFSVANITSFLAYIIAASVVFVFLWWAIRKAWRAIVRAATKGKASL